MLHTSERGGLEYFSLFGKLNTRQQRASEITTKCAIFLFLRYDLFTSKLLLFSMLANKGSLKNFNHSFVSINHPYLLLEIQNKYQRSAQYSNDLVSTCFQMQTPRYFYLSFREHDSFVFKLCIPH